MADPGAEGVAAGPPLPEDGERRREVATTLLGPGVVDSPGHRQRGGGSREPDPPGAGRGAVGAEGEPERE